MRTRAIAGGATASAIDFFIPAYCFATDLVGHFVYVMGDKVGDTYQVSKVDTTVPSKMPAVGVIVAKSSASDCVVQLMGIVRGVYTGMTPGKPQFVHTDAKPIEAFVRPATGIKLHQQVGVALSSTDLQLELLQPVIIHP